METRAANILAVCLGFFMPMVRVSILPNFYTNTARINGVMSDQEIIDINTADVETLATLPGIAEELARRIVEYRENVHPFVEVIELAAVPGISERMVRRFEDQATVGEFLTTVAEDFADLTEIEEEAKLAALIGLNIYLEEQKQLKIPNTN